MRFTAADCTIINLELMLDFVDSQSLMTSKGMWLIVFIQAMY